MRKVNVLTLKFKKDIFCRLLVILKVEAQLLHPDPDPHLKCGSESRDFKKADPMLIRIRNIGDTQGKYNFPVKRNGSQFTGLIT